MGFFWGEFLVQGLFWVLPEVLGIFLAPFDHPLHLKSQVPPPPGVFVLLFFFFFETSQI